MARLNQNGGFTLLELTCALFIITTAGFGAIQLYSVGMDHIVEMRECDAAVEGLRNAMELLRAQPFEKMEEADVFAAATPALASLHEPKTTVSVSAGDLPGLKEVTVSVRWQSLHGRWMERSLTTLVAEKSAGAAP